MENDLCEGYEPAPGWALIRRLGARSGFGEVWLAANHDMQTHSVFKFIQSTKGKSLTSLKNEVAKLRDVRHPGIITLQDAGLTHEIPWLRYEYIEGSVDLATACRYFREDYGPITSGDATRLICNIARIVADCHSRTPSLVHRDLKPENILVSDYELLSLLDAWNREEGQIAKPSLSRLPCRLLDFGISTHARDEKGLTHDVSLGRHFDGAGTWLWSSPQQAGGGESYSPHPSDDIFSLGCIWWWLLTAKLPSYPHRPEEFERYLANVQLTDPLRALLISCLSLDSRQRMQDAGKLWEGLQKEITPSRSVRKLLEKAATLSGCSHHSPEIHVRHITEDLVAALRISLDEFPDMMPLNPVTWDTRTSFPYDEQSLTFKEVETISPRAAKVLAKMNPQALSITFAEGYALTPNVAKILRDVSGPLRIDCTGGSTYERVPIALQKVFAAALAEFKGRLAPLHIVLHGSFSTSIKKAFGALKGCETLHIEKCEDDNSVETLSLFKGTLNVRYNGYSRLKWKKLNACRMRLRFGEFACPDMRALGEFRGELLLFTDDRRNSGPDPGPTCESVAPVGLMQTKVLTLCWGCELAKWKEHSMIPEAFIDHMTREWQLTLKEDSGTQIPCVWLRLNPRSAFWDRHRARLLHAHSKPFLMYLYEHRHDPDVAHGLRLPLETLPLETIRRMVDEQLVSSDHLGVLREVVRPVSLPKANVESATQTGKKHNSREARTALDILLGRNKGHDVSSDDSEPLSCDDWVIVDEAAALWVWRKQSYGRMTRLRLSLGSVEEIDFEAARYLGDIEHLYLSAPLLKTERLSAMTIVELCKKDCEINGNKSSALAKEWLTACMSLISVADQLAGRRDKVREQPIPFAYGQEAILEAPCELSVRTRKYLREDAGVRNLGDLLASTALTILDKTRLGELSVAELEEWLAANAFHLHRPFRLNRERREARRAERQAERRGERDK